MEYYTSEFKADAVSLVISSGRPIKQIAQELGINDTTLGTWVRAQRNASELTSGALSVEDARMEAENKRLKRRIAELEMEREILKRATAFWVKESNG